MNSEEIVPLLKLILARLDKLEQNSGSSNVSSSVSSSEPELPRSIKGFDEYCATFLNPFVDSATKLGGDAKNVGELTKEAWMELRKFLLMASACKEPPQASLVSLLSGMGAKVKAIGASVSRNEWEKHTKTCSEGIGCLNWVVIKPAPRDFVESFVGGSDYWANAIRREHKGKNQDHIDFCDTYKNLLINLMAYIKEYHTTGVSWNPKGIETKDYDPNSSPASSAATASSTPAPVKSPAPAAAPAAPAAPTPKVDLFAALNKGSSITSGLKTVTKDMQTWRAEYKSQDSAPAEKKASVSSSRAAETVKGTPRNEFQAGPSRWVVEYQSGSTPVEIQVNDKKESVYVFGCLNVSIIIRGKCKSIIIDNCKKTKVFFDTVMASCEIVNSALVEIRVQDHVSSVAIDKSDGVALYLPRTSLDTEILASKSSEMNVSFPDENDDWIERPIPEQYVHRIKGLTLTANVSDLYSH